MKKVQYIQQARCTGCRECLPVCPTKAIVLRTGKAVIDPEKCIDCGLCVKACSFGAPVEREVKK
ncbi:MAG TPA: 4Fe-4S binding protein [bacterium]|nr:4Fe-4S binding protein [bacterium]